VSSMRVARPAVLRRVPLDRHAVIEASAGTGKTFTLEHLLVELLLVGDVPIDRILVVTFTEKATNELRLRVRGKLEQLHRGQAPLATDEQVRAGDYWDVDDAARERIGKALHAFDGATIATIHAFCQRVLRENAFASGRLFEEEQVDGRDAFARALRDVLRSTVATDPKRAPWLSAALRTGWWTSRIEELLWKCLQARGDLRPLFDPDALEAAIAAFPVDDARHREGPAVMKTWGIPAQTAKKLGTELYKLALAVEEGRDAGTGPGFVLAAETHDVELDYIANKLTLFPPQGGPTGDACEAALALALRTPSLTAALAHTILEPVRQELAKRKREAGRYDFDDMLSLVDDALRGPRGPALVTAMRARWQCALIDEFQDTDETQWSIFRRAFFEPQPGSTARVYLVGDPKQSIYRFRGADMETYLRARDEVRQSGSEPVVLDTSYRATPELVEAANALFDASAPRPFFSGANACAPVACGRPESSLVDGDGNPVAPLLVLRLQSRTALPLLAARIAREIRTVTDPVRPWRLDGKPVAPEDVYVLSRTGFEGRVVGTALRAAGIPHAFFKEEGLFQTDEAREIRTLLWAIDDPQDRARRLAAWLTPFFGLPLGAVERARSLPATHPYVARLDAWQALAEARDFEHLFESIVSDSGILRREILLADSERDLTNTLHVLELLLEHARATRATLRDLIHALSGLIEKSRMPLGIEGNVQRLESERRAVQIMTVHKAKGLEAAVVFVVGGWSRGPEGSVRTYHADGQRFVWVGPTPASVKQRVDQEESEEDQRLMYVALTRAKGRVVLPLVTKDGAPARLYGAYEPVNRRVVDLAAAQSPSLVLEEVAPAPAPRPSAPPANDVTAAPPPPWQPDRALLVERDARAEHAALRESRAGAVVTSYTRLRAGARASWVDEPETRRAEKGADAVDEVPGATLTSSRASGVFVHEVLERVQLASFTVPFEAWRARDDVRALFDETIAVHRVEPDQRPHAERLVWNAYATPVVLPDGRTLARLADAARVVREMDFVFPVAESRLYVRGSIDLAFEHEGLTYFVDWKTDSLATYDPARLDAHVRDHYEDQVELYTLAVVKLLGVSNAQEHEARFGGLLYCFLRGVGEQGGGVWTARPSWKDLATWETALRARRVPGGKAR
jgi:exodeoxyribonuclease V beta subunit